MLKVVLNAQNTNQNPFCKCMISSCDWRPIKVGTLIIPSPTKLRRDIVTLHTSVLSRVAGFIRRVQLWVYIVHIETGGIRTYADVSK
jgi:hypothetical protein